MHTAVMPRHDTAAATKVAVALAVLALAAVTAATQLVPGVSPRPGNVAVTPFESPNAFAPLAGSAPPPTRAQVTRAQQHAPLAFTPNRGQFPEAVAFEARGAGYKVALTDRGAEVSLSGSGRPVRLGFAGASAHAAITGRRPAPGKVNYMSGSDRSQWHVDIPTYNRVAYERVWPGVDASFYGNRGRLEYDFIVAPGADASRIALSVGGATSLRKTSSGALRLGLHGGAVRQLSPRAYQLVDGVKRAVTSSYVVTGNLVRLRLGAYDHHRPLIIDPTLNYSTYLGGSADDMGAAVTLDGSGDAYIVGQTSSVDFPTQATPLQASTGGDIDVFVTKLSASGTPVYSTYLGGAGADRGTAVAVDSAGRAFLTGWTTSTNFPAPGTLQANSGLGDAFVTELNGDGNGIVYSTYLGGDELDVGAGIALDGDGNAYVAGATESGNFPTDSPIQANLVDGGDAFVTKLNDTGSARVYSTYLGGNSYDGATAIAVDPAGAAYVTGGEQSTTFPTQDPLQAAFGGDSDAFISKLNPTGSALQYSTYLGGQGADYGSGIAVDGDGAAYVTGRTAPSGTLASDFPTQNALQPNFGGGESDAFVAKALPDGSSLVYSTFLGGSGPDAGAGIAVNAGGEAFLTGYAGSRDFPTQNVLQPDNAGGMDAFVTRLNGAGSAFVYSTYLGGTGDDRAAGIAVGSGGDAVIAGWTSSTDFHTRSAFSASSGGGNDAFVAKLDPADLIPPDTAIQSAPSGVTGSSSASIGFAPAGSGETSSSECRLDGGDWAPCGSPYGATGLVDGDHHFEVRGVDSFGNRDPSPAEANWTVDTAPPHAAISAPTPVLTGQALTLDATGSTDVNGPVVGHSWDLDGDGSFETDTGTVATVSDTFASAQRANVGVRVTDRAGRTDEARTPVDVTPAPPAGPRGVSIDNAARYTNDPDVTLKLTWPALSQEALVSNDGGFDPATTMPVSAQVSWQLDSSGPERLPKTVYVRFLGFGAGPETYQDDIILDETAPLISSATLQPAGAAGAASAARAKLKRYVIRLRASDHTSGVARVQVRDKRKKLLASVRYKRKFAVKSRRAPVSVRARDRAGNYSKWRRLKPAR